MATRRGILKSLAATAISTRKAPLALAQLTTLEPSIRDPLRPAFHYLPARNWMNDPCGPIYYQGQYHLFHQYNPHAAVWGDMHWAHAISPDMVHWKRLPVALSPTRGGADSGGCFTGTAVVQNDRPTILYTGVQSVDLADATLADGTHTFRESQCLAVALNDTLAQWKKLPAPVIPVPPPGMKVTGFRDPSPWKDGDIWYAVVGSGVAGKGGMVLLYRSPNLRRWEYMHPLAQGTWNGTPGANPVDTGEMWECPDFFPLEDSTSKALKHVLIYSTQGKVLWQSGTLDRETMRFYAEKNGELDYGRVHHARVAFYAPKTQLDANGKRILWGWIGETRPEAAYSKAGWAGMMSLPRVLTLADGELHINPAQQVERLRQPSSLGNDVHEFVGTLRRSPTPEHPPLKDALGPVLTIRSAEDTHALRVDTATDGQIASIPVPQSRSDELSLRVFIDNSVIEIFLGGRFCVTHRFYVRDPALTVATLTLPGNWSLSGLQTFALERIWPV